MAHFEPSLRFWISCGHNGLFKFAFDAALLIALPLFILEKILEENGVNPVFGGKYIFILVYRQRYEKIPKVFVDSLLD